LTSHSNILQVHIRERLFPQDYLIPQTSVTACPVCFSVGTHLKRCPIHNPGLRQRSRPSRLTAKRGQMGPALTPVGICIWWVVLTVPPRRSSRPKGRNRWDNSSFRFVCDADFSRTYHGSHHHGFRSVLKQGIRYKSAGNPSSISPHLGQLHLQHLQERHHQRPPETSLHPGRKCCQYSKSLSPSI